MLYPSSIFRFLYPSSALPLSVSNNHKRSIYLSGARDLLVTLTLFPCNEGDMVGISFLVHFQSGLTFFNEYAAGTSKEFQWVASVLSGIFFCVIIYRLTGLMSLFWFKGYCKLSSERKVEWNNRGFSTFHALFVTFASSYLLLLSDTFSEELHKKSIVNRSSTLSNTILGISIGYFLSDLAMILWNFPALGGLEYVLHHGLSMLSILLSLLSGQGQIYILMVLFTESTTPFVNLRWYLDAAGQKNSKLYICNGIALFVGWLVARILLFIFFFIHMMIHFDQVMKIFPLGFYTLLVVPPILAMMNMFWFWKIARGLIKTLSKAKHSK